MPRRIKVALEHWPLREPFRIARGTRTEAQLVTVGIALDGTEGRGESAPNLRYGETPHSVMAQIRAVEPALADGISRAELMALLPAGSARCAVDCAMWDLEAALGLGRVFDDELVPVICARTIGIDTPARMAAAASRLIEAKLVKVKLDGEYPEARLRAVRAVIPDASLIVDANESWTIDQVAELQPLLLDLKVALLEQPLPAGDDHGLIDLRPLVPICADESCYTSDDIEGLRDRYQSVNIKLDKAGGLTEAMSMLGAARAVGMGVMVGCMVGTSLGMTPALALAGAADYADLDGPWLLKTDRSGGLTFTPDGHVHPPRACFWGSRRRPRISTGAAQ